MYHRKLEEHSEALVESSGSGSAAAGSSSSSSSSSSEMKKSVSSARPIAKRGR